MSKVAWVLANGYRLWGQIRFIFISFTPLLSTKPVTGKSIQLLSKQSLNETDGPGHVSENAPFGPRSVHLCLPAAQGP